MSCTSHVNHSVHIPFLHFNTSCAIFTMCSDSALSIFRPSRTSFSTSVSSILHPSEDDTIYLSLIPVSFSCSFVLHKHTVVIGRCGGFESLKSRTAKARTCEFSWTHFRRLYSNFSFTQMRMRKSKLWYPPTFGLQGQSRVVALDLINVNVTYQQAR